MRMFSVKFNVPMTQLSSVIAKLPPEFKLEILELDNPTLSLPRPRPTPDDSMVSKTAFKIITECLADGKPHTLKELQPVLEAAGLSRHSVSPSLSKLRMKGIVKWVEDGTYQLN